MAGSDSTRQKRRVKFSKKFVDGVIRGTTPGGPWTDTESPLRLKATKGGASFSVNVKVGGKGRTLTPGDSHGKSLRNSATILTLAEARRWAREVVASLTLGHAPQPTKCDTTTFAELAERYLAAYGEGTAPTQRGRGKPARTSFDTETQGINYALAVLGDLFLSNIDTEAARALKVRYAESPASARKAWGAAKRVLDLGVERGLVTLNVIAALPAPQRPRPKSRYPKLAELAAIWRACEELGTVRADMIRFAMVMPLRSNTIASLTWPEVDLEHAELRLQPGAGRKFQEAQRLPLPSLAVELLRERDRYSTLVFDPSDGSPKRIASTVETVRKRSGVRDWSLHDFRRSAVTLIAEHRPGVSETALDRWLTHSASSTTSGVRGTYQRAQGFAGMKQAAAAWDELLREALR